MLVKTGAGSGARSRGSGAGGRKPGAGIRGSGAGGAVRCYRDLRVWQAAMDLVEQVYQISLTFPADEKYELRSQLRRAVVSIPSNIAEGHARESTREYLNFLSIAQGSLAELETHLEIARRLKYVTPDLVTAVFQNTRSLGKQLHALRNALESRG